MTINDFINTLKEHNVDFNKDLAIVCDDENYGEDFSIEESNFCIFLCKTDWGKLIQNKFLK